MNVFDDQCFNFIDDLFWGIHLTVEGVAAGKTEMDESGHGFASNFPGRFVNCIL